MATASEQLTDLIESVICSEVYTDPRSLPCLHTYCLRCVEGFTAGRQAGDDFPCPQCRQEFQIPIGGVCKLRKNFFIEKLKDLHESKARDANHSIGADGHVRLAAVMYGSTDELHVNRTRQASTPQMSVTRTTRLPSAGNNSPTRETTINIMKSSILLYTL